MMNEKDLDKVLWTICNEIGIPHNIKGRTYIQDAIKILERCPDRIDWVIKGIYVPIADWHEDTVSRVERAIRHAVEVAWKRGNVTLINKIFGYTVCYDRGRPTNSEFIYNVYDFVKTFGEDVLNGTYKF